ncbi:zinc finger FYVE domain-containing protein 9 isoform 3, partial [Camelus ferus]
MENYFQAEAYNLDKVLDEFEENEDETVSPILLDTKWNKILDPPSHRLPFNPALASVNEPAVSESQPQLKVFSLAHSATLNSEGEDHCANGQDCSLNPEINTMWIDENVVAEDQLIKRNCNRDDQCSTVEVGEKKCGNLACLPDEKNVLVVAVMHNCDKRTLQSDLQDCNNYNSQSLMDAFSCSLDNENRQTDQFSFSINGSTEKGMNLEKQMDPITRPNAEGDSVKHICTTSSDNLASVCSPSQLQDDENIIGRDPSMSVITSLSLDSVISSQGTDEGPTVKQEDCIPDEDLTVKTSSPRTDPGSPNSFSHLSEGTLMNEEPAEERTTEESIQSGLPLLLKAGMPNGSGRDDTCEQFSDCLVPSEVRADENEGCKHEEILGTTELLNMTEHFSESQEMTNWKLTKPNKVNDSQVNKENEKFLQVDQPEDTHDDSGGECGKMAEAALDLKGTCINESEGCDFSTVMDTPAANSLPNCCDSYGMQSPVVCFVPKTLPSKEDSVTEEKEIEESKSECYSNIYEQRGNEATEGTGLLLNNTGDLMKKNYLHNFCSQVPSVLGQSSPKIVTNLQSISVPFGGARPKQPSNLKLQIPKPLSDHLQNDLPSNNGNNIKNKNDILGKAKSGENSATNICNASLGNISIVDTNGEHLESYESGISSRPCLALAPESPDNDLRAGQFGISARKPFTTLGEVAPVWVPDSQAPNCMKCEARFTFTKRRHHCRACGKKPYQCHSDACFIFLAPQVAQPREQRRVWFADGILPNGEVADAAKLTMNGTSSAGTLAVSHDPVKPVTSSPLPAEADISLFSGSITQVGSPVGSAMNLIPEDGLPPILISTGVKGDYAVEEKPSQISVMQQLEDGGPDPLVFVLNANLLSMVKIVNWNVVGNLGHSFFSQSFLGSKEHGGFLYVTSTYQSLQDLVLPTPPYLFGILIQKWETPWAKVFPIRLMLRLGAEYRLYPCPLFSVRFRKPLFGETGHTIMNLLADFRNYQYTLPVVQGLVVDMEVRKTSIKIPSNRYNE